MVDPETVHTPAPSPSSTSDPTDRGLLLSLLDVLEHNIVVIDTTLAGQNRSCPALLTALRGQRQLSRRLADSIIVQKAGWDVSAEA